MLRSLGPRPLLALGLLAPMLLAALPGTALADCAAPPAVEEAVKDAEIVFVGTVASTANRGTWATVTVEEVWRGPDLAESVLVKGGPGAGSASSIDRSFEVGVRYLFFPRLDPSDGLIDNICTSTAPWRADLAALRPSDSRAPVSTGTEGGLDLGWLWPILALVGGVSVLLLVAGLLARGRQDA